GAARVPYSHVWIGAKQRDHLLAEGTVKARVAEHRRHVDREVEQESLHTRWVVQDTLLKARERLEPLLLHPIQESAPDRSVGVRAEIESVVTVDPLEQELQLDALALALVRDRAS